MNPRSSGLAAFVVFASLVVSGAALRPVLAQETSLTRSTERDEAEAKRLFEQGKQALDAGKFQAAAELFRRSYELSGRPHLLFNQALALERAGSAHDALLLARDARSQLPQEKWAVLDALIARLEDVVSEDQRAREFFNLSQSRMQQGLYAEAALGFAEAYKLSGKPEMQINQARAMAKSGDNESALRLIRLVKGGLQQESPLWAPVALLHATLEREVAVAAQQRGALRVTTTPVDALVHVDGTLLGRGDDQVAAGSFGVGTHQIDVSRQGFISATRVVELGGEELRNDFITLQPAPCAQAGQRRVMDAPEFCCWPGQRVADGVCTGRPSCPAGLEPIGDNCRAPAVVPPANPQQQAKYEHPSSPAKRTVEMSFLLVPMWYMTKENPLEEETPYYAAVQLGGRVGYRVHPHVSVDASYLGGGGGMLIGIGPFELDKPEAVHTSYLLAGLHSATIRQRRKRDRFVRLGIIPHHRGVTLERDAVVYTRRGWGLPMQLGVNFMRGEHFGFALELHAEWLSIGKVCEHGAGRGCVDGGSALRLGLGMSFNWSAP